MYTSQICAQSISCGKNKLLRLQSEFVAMPKVLNRVLHSLFGVVEWFAMMFLTLVWNVSQLVMYQYMKSTRGDVCQGMATGSIFGFVAK